MNNADKNERLVVYDGECPVCTRVATKLDEREWETPHCIVAFQDLEGELAQKMVDEGIDRQMLVYDPEEETTVGGINAIRELQLSSNRKATGWLLGLPVVSQVASWGYRLFSANRRFFP